MRLAAALVLAALPCAAAPPRGAPLSKTKAAVLAEAERLAPEIGRMAAELWQLSETALKEQRSAPVLAEALEKEGFTLERGVAGMPTAFAATFGRGRPVIGILAEFDALPGIGNEPVPRREERKDGVKDGHGCGHNLFGSASVGAAVALKRVLQAQGLPGTLKVFGTPAEETLVGKVYMARERVFDGLDAALDWHPGTETRVLNDSGQALNNFTVEFFGKASHGALDPWNGRSALDAVEVMTHAVNLMREHVPTTARLHYVIPSGGDVPNVVPAYARVWFYVRDSDRPSVERHYEWLARIAEAAALATQTTHKLTLTTGVHEYNLNRPLQEAMQKNLDLVGAPAWGEEEQRFARELQAFLKLPEKGLASTVEPLSAGLDPVRGGSTDSAEVSCLTPTGALVVATAGEGLPWHSWATAASHGLPGASRGAVVAAKVLAATGADLFTDPQLLTRAQDAFKRKAGGQPYRSPIPPGQKPPLPAPPAP
jgi:aminobenzoyl-glutamate utilization protein B